MLDQMLTSVKGILHKKEMYFCHNNSVSST